MAYQQETFSIPKISVNGSFRINLRSLLTSAVVNRLPAVKNGLLFFFSSAGSFISNVGSKITGLFTNFKFKKYIPIFIFGLFVLWTGYLAYRRIISSSSSGEIQIK